MASTTPQISSSRTMLRRLRVGYAAYFSVAMAGAALGHIFRPRKLAKSAAWDYSPWYQREIALFDLAHAYGLARLIKSPDDNLYSTVFSLTLMLLGLNHAAAIARGDSGGTLNWSMAVGNTALGASGLIMARANSRAVNDL